MAYTAFGRRAAHRACAFERCAITGSASAWCRTSPDRQSRRRRQRRGVLPRAGALAHGRAQSGILSPADAASLRGRRARGDPDDRTHALRRSRVDSHRVRSGRRGLKDRSNLLQVTESVQVLSPTRSGDRSRSAPARRPCASKDVSWMSVFHGVDVISDGARKPTFRYSAGIVIHDLERPDRSALPLAANRFWSRKRARTQRRRRQRRLPDRHRSARRSRAAHFDVYYGMGDYSSVGRALAPDARAARAACCATSRSRPSSSSASRCWRRRGRIAT